MIISEQSHPHCAMWPQELQRGEQATTFKWRQQKHGDFGCLDTNFYFFFFRWKEKSWEQHDKQQRVKLFPCRARKNGMQYLSSAICSALSCLPSVCSFLFLIPPSWINVEGLVVTQQRPGSALAKCHPARGTWAQHSLHGKQGRTRRGGWGEERSGSAQFPSPHPPVHSQTPPAALGEGRLVGCCFARWLCCLGGRLGNLRILLLSEGLEVGFRGEVPLQQLLWLEVALSSAGFHGGVMWGKGVHSQDLQLLLPSLFWTLSAAQRGWDSWVQY